MTDKSPAPAKGTVMASTVRKQKSTKSQEEKKAKMRADERIPEEPGKPQLCCSLHWQLDVHICRQGTAAVTLAAMIE
jgi:hypothetical protein